MESSVLNSFVTPFVSVIIPVYNDAYRLSRCLKALEHQTYPKLSYEVIVVDNNSEENISSITELFSQAILVKEERKGSYAARNKGISIAKGTVLAFTDSDCIPVLDWIEKGVQCLLANPNCGLSAGKIELFFKNPSKPTAVEVYDSINFLRQEHYIKALHFGATANVFTFKQMFDVVGLFNADLKSGGDQEWGNRVFAAGYTQVYAEEACVAHPARHELSELKQKVTRVTEGHYNLKSQDKGLYLPYLKEIFIDISPSIKDIKDIVKAFLNQNLHGLEKKMEFIYVILSLKYAKAGKKTQLYWMYLTKNKQNTSSTRTCQS
ncbi:glycosyltransferase family 2 protein [Leptolyngbya sp. FACHB-321]|uniref:glycosyltransferase n=1 Tax=Leptolyngbya sp. FACHB-321 TaxID=2692807 RepID=UPI0016857D9A|nr:glycosyltransferase family A protein [Leptolyngbya sp. FACHB-321]MBD2038534.1 glycosyltransferase family 2 protein [Leptolyngbya sp. FACHB-321]